MFSPFLTLSCNCDKARRWIQTQLRQAGLRTVQTFDLRSARHASGDCPCPHHGTAKCDCQMAVLLVYGEKGEPVTLILHGNDGQTRLSIAAEDGAQQRSAELLSVVQETLENQLLSS
ncbi:MAG: hypothetical protein Fur0043_06390 [Anaerolineales bacterium]